MRGGSRNASALLRFPSSAVPLGVRSSSLTLAPCPFSCHRLVQEPNSFFMDVRCLDCFTITCVFSHAQTVVYCSNCSTMLCTPTGGQARLSEGCSFRKKTA